jgi:hypothetical protein
MSLIAGLVVPFFLFIVVHPVWRYISFDGGDTLSVVQDGGSRIRSSPP